MGLKAIFLNCTLKYSPEVSNTRALIDKAVELFGELGIESEVVRVNDYRIRFGTSSDMGEGDEWPQIYEKIKNSDIIVIGSPIWFGVRSSIAQLVMERLDGSYADGDSVTGQYHLYGKTAGVIITGNEDGAHDVAANTLFNLTHLGCVIPPNADCYWVGDAGPGPSYIEAGGDKHLYTNRTVRYMVNNLAWMAGLLKQNKNPVNLKKIDEDARKVSR
ncbi:flavodoxin family protein [Methanoplanus sp. FWC-SCC4]|uniref:Flavodoxin family protein n=1 Tax=Methanochimaera problematica TaxID=2609417 RepID=A0AA97I317_9EURY|nr:flavodoxin family protein [Methanoplanus sp. FWC-SCC4]WOF15416.1 flavodoxin family protein [Methanoplanus sp. FWC-SCC4]